MRVDDVTIGYLPVGHDPSIAIIDDSGVLAVAEEERYSRIKRGRFVTDPEWFFEVLGEFHIDPVRVTCLAVPNVVALQERRTLSSLEPVPRFGQARLVSAIVNRITARLPSLESVEHHRHHVCHAASAYLASPFDTAAVVTVDGMGELETASISLGSDGRLVRITATDLPDSLGYVYQALAWWSGLTGAEREGKFMGLASWGSPTQVDLMKDCFVDVLDDGSFRISENLAKVPVTTHAWYAYVTETLGPQRSGDPDVPDPVAADVAASIQVIIEEALLGYCGKARKLVMSENLCLAGGVFMNTVANGAIQRSGLFESVFVQPLASDNGLALGAGLLSHRRRSPHAGRWVMTSAALGTRLDHEEGLTPAAASMVDAVTERLLAGQVVGWARGRAEVGARALGQRSVLADARDPLTRDRINNKLKRRERWRPFAPVILEEDAIAWGVPTPSPFMTFVHSVPLEVRVRFPAVFHIDGTTRLQTVPRDADPVLRALLLRVRKEIGVGILLNTSLNGPGMPIVRTHEQVLDLLRTSELDCMVVGNDILERAGLAAEPSTCMCQRPQIETLVEVVSPDPSSCIESHAERVHRIQLSAPDASCPLQSVRDLALPRNATVTVLVPTWLDLLAECAPSLTAWLEQFQGQFSIPISVIDGSGRTVLLSDLTQTARPGLGGSASEIETFWLSGVARWST